jgi:leader peptidase (prepilin peptidase)/N-methyltransferase
MTLSLPDHGHRFARNALWLVVACAGVALLIARWGEAVGLAWLPEGSAQERWLGGVVINLFMALFGAALGSFLNVVAYRMPRGESIITGGSHCPHCHHSIRPWHNLPVAGWLVLRGACYDCRHPISSRYAWVELATSAMFVWLGVGAHLRGNGEAILVALELFAAWSLAAALLVLVLVAADRQPVPRSITTFFWILGAALLVATAAAGWTYHRSQGLSLWPAASLWPQRAVAAGLGALLMHWMYRTSAATAAAWLTGVATGLVPVLLALATLAVMRWARGSVPQSWKYGVLLAAALVALGPWDVRL